MTYRFIKICVLLLCSVFTLSTFAQNFNSTVSGTVRDVTGAVVPGATVDLTNVGTGQTLTTTSKADGFYNFTNLSPANYRVSVTMQGFTQWVGVLTLRVSQSAPVDPKLTAASVSTKVTVRDVTPVIDKVNSTISDVKNATAIATIPVANRNILNILAFSPGVVAGTYGGSGSGYTRMNGTPPGSTDYLVDGQSMTNRNTNELQANPQPTPTFQEVKVITSNGDAQYGSPGVVELVTKSGTNHFHGQIYELNQNNHLQAKVFRQQSSVPYLQHNEYGFQVGGPVWAPKIYNGRNKTFFFVDMEWIKQNANQLVQYIVPTLAQRQGDLSTVYAYSGSATGAGIPITIYDPLTTGPGADGPYSRTAFTDNQLPSQYLNPVTQRIFGVTPVAGLVPLALPNVPGAEYWNYVPNYIPPVAKNTIDNKLYTFKVDQVFGLSRLAARYTYTDSNLVHPRTYAPTEPDDSIQGGHNGSLTFTEVINPRVINVAHIGIQYNNHNQTGPIPIAGVASKIGVPFYQTDQVWPQFYFNHYGYNIPDAYWTGIDRTGEKQYPDQTITATDQFSYNKGNHQLKFGFEFNNLRIITRENGQAGGDNDTTGFYTAQQNQNAVVNGVPVQDVPVTDTGSGLADFLLGDMDGLFVNYYPDYHTRQSEFDGYALDDWRATPNLTLNLGLRYQYWTAFSDASGMSATFDPNIPGGMMVYQGSGATPSQVPQAVYQAFLQQGLLIESAAAAHYPLSLYNMPKNNFEPRLGFAYQLDSKTVLRGGYGIYQFSMPLYNFQASTRQNPPFSYSATYGNDQVAGGNPWAAELEFPIPSAQYGGNGGTIPINNFQLGSQGCPIGTSGYPPGPPYPAGTCTGGGFQVVPSDAAASITATSAGWGARFLDPNFKASLVQEYNLTLARELPFHTGFQLSYIGNHSTHLMMIDLINGNIPRLSCPGSGTTDVAQCEAGTSFYRKMYPTFGSGLAEYTYNGYANTNELQAQLTHTWGNGLMLQSYFTWGHYLTTSDFGNYGQGAPSGAGGGPNGGNSTDNLIPAAQTTGYNLTQIGSGAPTSERLRAVYSNDPSLPTKTFQVDGHYQLPFGKGQAFLGNAHGFLNAVVSGFNLSAFFIWHSGFYFAPYYSVNGSAGPNGNAISLAPGKNGILPASQRNAAEWFDSSIYDPTTNVPYAGQAYEYAAGPDAAVLSDYNNNVPPNYMTGPGFNRLDATVYKLTPLWRNLTLDFEAQFLNVYNHQNLGIPNLTTGQILSITGGAGVNGDYPRTIQLQAKVIF